MERSILVPAAALRQTPAGVAAINPSVPVQAGSLPSYRCGTCRLRATRSKSSLRGSLCRPQRPGSRTRERDRARAAPGGPSGDWRMAALDLLRDARQALADEGNWCQHYAVHPSGRGKSVLGAVGYRFYAADHPDTMAAVQLLARAIGREVQHLRQCVRAGLQRYARPRRNPRVIGQGDGAGGERCGEGTGCTS